MRGVARATEGLSHSRNVKASISCSLGRVRASGLFSSASARAAAPLHQHLRVGVCGLFIGWSCLDRAAVALHQKASGWVKVTVCLIWCEVVIYRRCSLGFGSALLPLLRTHAENNKGSNFQQLENQLNKPTDRKLTNCCHSYASSIGCSKLRPENWSIIDVYKPE